MAAKKPAKKRKASKGAVLTRQILGHIARIFMTLFLIGVITGCVVVTAITIYVMNFMETDAGVNLDNISLAETTIFYANDENGVQQEVYRMAADENHIEVTIDQIPQHVIDAFVCTEDKRFFDHDGVDWLRTIKVTVNSLLKRSSQGGSTITQQLIKNATNDDDVTPVRKIREIFRAIQLERQYTKPEILEKYLNIIFLGGRNRGIEAASQAYFGCSVSDLTVPQAASLAGMTRSPNSWRPDLYPEKNKERRNYSLGWMRDEGKITEEEYQKYCAEPVVTVDTSKEDDKNPSSSGQTAQGVTSYYVDAAIEESISDLMKKNDWSREHATDRLRQGGYRIYLNVDTRIQKIVEEKFLDWQTFSPKQLPLNQDKLLPEAAFVVTDLQGSVVALVGGKGEKTQSRAFNRATMAPRSPGSAIKPLAVYAPAVEYDLINWSTVLVDSPALKNAGKDWPRNFSGKYEGDVTVVYALRKSLNTIPVKLIQQLTPQRSVDFMEKKFGISTFVKSGSVNDFGPSLTLGSMSKGMYLEEITAAYAAFGNGGLYYKPSTYSRIEDANGNLIYDNTPTKNRAISEDTATILNRLLRQVVVGPSGTGKKASMGDMDVIGKTGTSQDYNDRAFIGLTPYYVGGFWTGYDTPAELPESKLYSPDAVWKTVMADVHKGLDPKQFALSDNVVAMEFCTESGLAVTSRCPKTETGYYKKNALPEACDFPHGETKTEGGGGGDTPLDAPVIN